MTKNNSIRIEDENVINYIFKCMDISWDDIPRYRKTIIEKDTDDKMILVIETRAGGGNREDYPAWDMTRNEYYSHDEDDSFDSTYANFYFNVPEKYTNDFLILINAKNNDDDCSLQEKIILCSDDFKRKVGIYKKKEEKTEKYKEISKKLMNEIIIYKEDIRKKDNYIELLKKNQKKERPPCYICNKNTKLVELKKCVCCNHTFCSSCVNQHVDTRFTRELYKLSKDYDANNFYCPCLIGKKLNNKCYSRRELELFANRG